MKMAKGIKYSLIISLLLNYFLINQRTTDTDKKLKKKESQNYRSIFCMKMTLILLDKIYEKACYYSLII